MLTNASVATMIAVRDLDQARQFYEEKLGLTAAQVIGDLILYHCGAGTSFAIYTSGYAGSAQNTVMAWRTADLDATVADLRSRGVVFEEYDMPGLKTVNGIAELGGIGRGAWFKDPDGNIMALDDSASR
jgi:catechol 2,3-dioxygenase-like lactoylglutathione lyase family enzyme